VQRSDSEIVVAVGRFALADVIYGEFKTDMPLLLPEGASIEVDENGEVSSMTQGLTLPGWNPTFSTKGPMGMDVSVSGKIDFPIGVSGKFDGRIPLVNKGYECNGSKYCIDELLLKMDLGVNAQLKISAISSFEDSAEKSKEFLSVPLAKIPIGSTPFVFKPTLVFDASIKGSVSGKAGVEATANGTINVPVGFDYIRGEGLSTLPNSRYPVTTSASLEAKPVLEASAEASAELNVRLVLALGVVGADLVNVSGPNAILGLYANGTFAPFSSPDCLTGEFGVQACLEAALTVGLGDFTVLDLGSSRLCKQFPLASWNDAGQFCLEPPEGQSLADMLNKTHDAIDCSDPGVQQSDIFAGTCLEDFNRHCFDPQGECHGTVYDGGRVIQRWPDGHSLEMYYDLTGTQPPKPIRFFDTTQQICSDSLTEPAEPDAVCLSTTTSTLHQDDPDGTYMNGDQVLTCQTDADSVDVSCPDGTVHHLTLPPNPNPAAQICARGGKCHFVAEPGPGPELP
jgi:hypothetical protein